MRESTKSNATVETPSTKNLLAQDDPTVVLYRLSRKWVANSGSHNTSGGGFRLGGGAKEVLGVTRKSTEAELAMALYKGVQGLEPERDDQGRVTKNAPFISFVMDTPKGGIEVIKVSAPRESVTRNADALPF